MIRVARHLAVMAVLYAACTGAALAWGAHDDQSATPPALVGGTGAWPGAYARNIMVYRDPPAGFYSAGTAGVSISDAVRRV